MNCEWVKTNSALYVYDELADDARHELEMHLNKCDACKAEVGEMLNTTEETAKNTLFRATQKLRGALAPMR